MGLGSDSWSTTGDGKTWINTGKVNGDAPMLQVTQLSK